MIGRCAISRDLDRKADMEGVPELHSTLKHKPGMIKPGPITDIAVPNITGY